MEIVCYITLISSLFVLVHHEQHLSVTYNLCQHQKLKLLKGKFCSAFVFQKRILLLRDKFI